MAEKGNGDAVPTGSGRGQSGKYPRNEEKKLELSLMASDKTLSAVAILSGLQ